MYSDFKLLVDGKNAFEEIIECIRKSNKSIDVNMFIWRNDNIGNILAKELYEAASRGVKVNISIDRYGMILELSEEYRSSFFHEKPSLFEKISIKTLEIVYPKLHIKGIKNKGLSEFAVEFINHENINVSRNILKKDHSKYWIFDEQILILGGINVEDKENGKDISGRFYQDYMVKLNGSLHVEVFREKLRSFKNIGKDYYFGLNYNGEYRSFEMDKLYMDMINNSEKELIITMPYFSPLKRYVNAIINAYNRGVKIVIMIPSKSNFQSDSNYKMVHKLMKLSKNNIRVLLSPKMVHTKMIINEKLISIGSTNINNKSFDTLMELNLFLNNVESSFRTELFESISINHSLCKEIFNYRELKYNKLIAFFERFVV